MTLAVLYGRFSERGKTGNIWPFSRALRLGETVLLAPRQRREALGITAELLLEFGHARFEVRVLRDANRI